LFNFFLIYLKLNNTYKKKFFFWIYLSTYISLLKKKLNIIKIIVNCFLLIKESANSPFKAKLVEVLFVFVVKEIPELLKEDEEENKFVDE
jgi:hypothetical protein